MDLIETERLLLEPVDASRLDEFVALTAESDTMRYWSLRGAFSRDDAERNFEASLASLREHGFGWMLAPPARGHGYATEAGGAVRDEAFVRLGLESIVAGHHPANAVSGRVMEKLGMTFEHDVVDKNGWPTRLYRLSRAQWSSKP